MSKYIDADELTGFYEPYKDMKVSINALLEQIKDIPSADVIEVRHGHWINDVGHTGWTCSECGDHEGNKIDKYCSNCGAKMDGEEQKYE